MIYRCGRKLLYMNPTRGNACDRDVHSSNEKEDFLCQLFDMKVNFAHDIL